MLMGRVMRLRDVCRTTMIGDGAFGEPGVAGIGELVGGSAQRRFHQIDIHDGVPDALHHDHIPDVKGMGEEEEEDGGDGAADKGFE